MNIREIRRERFKAIGQSLVESLKQHSIGDTDTEVQGKAAEREFRAWLDERLPTRFGVFNGAVLSSNSLPTTERDCLVFDHGFSPYFALAGRQPNLFPIEGLICSIEVNTGKSGTTASKISRDLVKLSKTGRLYKDRTPDITTFVQLNPVELPAEVMQLLGVKTLREPFAVSQQTFSTAPLLYLFIENLRGTLDDLAQTIQVHNKKEAISSSVSGAFVVNRGYVLHMNPGEGWNGGRLAGFPLAYVAAEPWEVLLKMMEVIWSQCYKVLRSAPNLGSYYADRSYYLDVEEQQAIVLQDTEYIEQTEEGFITYRG